MIGLLCFFLAVLASPFKSKLRLQLRTGASTPFECLEAQAAWLMVRGGEILSEERGRCVFWELVAFPPGAHEAALSLLD
jgi:hypothetical protein